jgi:type II secretory pathway pseudopilin PulG
VSAQPARRNGKERGVLIVALMAGIAIMLILSTAAVQSWADITRRDNEAEMIFRAQDIVRALKRFQLDKGKLPTELKELLEPGQRGQYMLRQLWKDPLVKDGKWQLVYASPTGGLFDPTAPQVPPGTNGANPPGSPPSLLNPTDNTGNPTAPFGAPPGTGNPGDPTADPTGMPIAGVKTKCKDKPFRKYKDKTEYKEWVFSIFDLDPQRAAQTPAQTNNPPPGLKPGDLNNNNK